MVAVIWGAAGFTVSTVKVRDRTVLSFPAASIALTKRVWVPFESGAAAVSGETQAFTAVESKWHWKVEPASFEEKPKVGVESPVGPVGPELMLATGGVVSAVKDLKVL